MKRSLIAIAAAALALGTSVAVAQDQFMDSYWKQLDITHSIQPMTTSEASRSDFDFVDRYPAQ